MRNQGATIRHETRGPRDDRPSYMKADPFRLAVDTETNGQDWHSGGAPFLVTASDYDRDYLWVIDPTHGADVKRERAEVRRALLDADEWIFHNAPFDIHMLVAAGIIEYDDAFERVVHDTHLMARSTLGYGVHVKDFKLKTLGDVLVDSSASQDQKDLREAMKSLGLIRSVDQIKVPGEAFIETWRVYPDVVEKYAMQDPRITYDLYHVLDDRMTPDNRSTYEFERVIQPTFIRMERDGVPVDPDAVVRLKEQYSMALADELDSLRASRGEDFNPNSKEDIIALFADHGIELTDLTETGEIRTDRGILDRYAGAVPEVDTILSARTHEKFLATFVAPMENRTRTHPNFSQYGARTGRASSYSPNFQNIPVRAGTEVRDVIVAPEGHKLVVADYSSIELRLLAHYMGDDALWDIIEGGDPFLWLGEQVFGTPDQDSWPVKRGPLKNGFYALTYGAGGPKLAKTIGGGMTDQEGRDLAKRIKNALGPAYFDLIRALKRAAQARGYVKTILGRVQWLPIDDRTGKIKDYVALNSLIQGSAADILKHALALTALEVSALGGRTILTVHDEIVSEVPEDAADAALEVKIATMKSAEQLVTKGKLVLEVDGKVVNKYGEAK